MKNKYAVNIVKIPVAAIKPFILVAGENSMILIASSADGISNEKKFGEALRKGYNDN